MPKCGCSCPVKFLLFYLISTNLGMILYGKTDSAEVESLLSLPVTDSGISSEPTQRLEINYKNLSKKYELWLHKDTNHQYCRIYSKRLSLMRPKVENKVKKKWPDDAIKGLHELEEGSECVIVGTIFKRQELKPSILLEIAEEHKLLPQPVLEKFTSENDDIILEDEMQRVQLIGKIDIPKLVTGVICAVKGKEDKSGKFNVEEICFADLPVPKHLDVISADRYLLVVSGLELNKCANNLLPLELLVDYVVGHLGQPAEQTAISAIARVIIAGNSISGSKKNLPLREKVRLMQDFDDIASQLASVCPVDVMSGEFDPANHLMPQQPLHRCLLPKASKYSSLQTVTNPYEFELGGRIIVGSSGQNVNDVGMFSTLVDPIEILEKMCLWGHIAPTAPDTLPSHPYADSEPFIMESCPDVIFAGNQKTFQCKTIRDYGKPCLLLSVPKFSETGVCVLVNLKTLEAHPMKFCMEPSEL